MMTYYLAGLVAGLVLLTVSNVTVERRLRRRQRTGLWDATRALEHETLMAWILNARLSEAQAIFERRTRRIAAAAPTEMRDGGN